MGDIDFVEAFKSLNLQEDSGNTRANTRKIEIPFAQPKIEEGKRKLDNLLQSEGITLRDYLDEHSEWSRRYFYTSKLHDLSYLDDDILQFLLTEYFKPYSREARAGFPQIPAGCVRLFRGEQQRDIEKKGGAFQGQGRWWTQFLDNAIETYAIGEGAKVYYLDVPEEVAQRSIVARTRESLDRPVGGSYAMAIEFYIPQEYVDGERGVQNNLDPTVINGLLGEGEFTQYGVDSHIKYYDQTKEQQDLHTVRSRLLDFIGDALYQFWSYYDYHNDPKFLEKYPGWKESPPQQPSWPDSVETAEYLLAKISGWGSKSN